MRRSESTLRAFAASACLVLALAACTEGGDDRAGGSSGGSASSSGGAGGASVGAGGVSGGSAGTSAMGLSCAELPKICGPNGDTDCCGSSVIPGGSFVRDNGLSGDFEATVSTFRMDIYEVTVGRFKKFLEDYEAHLPASGSGKNPNNPYDPGWDPEWNASLLATRDEVVAEVEACDANLPTWSTGDDAMPMACLTWFEAYAFCIWDGGRLPTDAERNYAASGGAEQRMYPWSDPPESEELDRSYCVYAADTEATHSAERVGSCSPKGDARWGQADMSGNLWEWAQDWYLPFPERCINCASLVSYSIRTIRGGSFYGDGESLLACNRLYHAPNIRDYAVGVRCVRSP